MKKYYSFLDGNDKLVENSCFCSHCPIAACKKIFRRYLRGMEKDTKLYLTVVDLKTQKRHYYLCVGKFLEQPIATVVDPKRRVVVYQRHQITVVKIIKDMVGMDFK